MWRESAERAGFPLREQVEELWQQIRVRRRQPVWLRLEVRDGAAGLLDDDPRRRPVPRLQPALVVAVEAARREPGEVQRCRPGAADVSHARKNATEDPTLLVASLGVVS